MARLTGPRPRLDPRVTVDRPGCIDVGLAAQIAAASYVEPVRLICHAPRVLLRARSDPGAIATSELLAGEAFDVFDTAGDWTFGHNPADRYAGWVPSGGLTLSHGAMPSRVVTARSAPVFSLPDIKSPVTTHLPFGARVAGVPDHRFLALDAGGFLHCAHLEPLPRDPVAIATRFLGAPYLWGGRTPCGVDCSGLVQAALAACGLQPPRDSDQQATLGREVAFPDRARGDLVCFPGHIGILADIDTLLHANAHWMAVVKEPLAAVIDRGTAITTIRRVSIGPAAQD